MATTRRKMMKEGNDYAAAFEDRPKPDAAEGATGDTGAAPAVATSDTPVERPIETAPPEAAAAAPAAPDAAAPEGQGGAPGELNTPSETLSVAEPTNGDAMGDTEMADHAAHEGGAPMTEQQLRSWQGRLKKLEAELKAKAEAANQPVEEVASDALEDTAEHAEGMGQDEQAASIDAVADQVESGEMTPEQAMAALAEDFGEPFIKMIEMIATNAAGKAAEAKVGDVSKAVGEIIEDIVDSRAKSHFDAIRAARGDFEEVVNSSEFKAYVAAQQGDQKAETMRILEAGSAQEIIALLQAYSDSAANAGPAEEPAAAAAEAPAAAAPVEEAASTEEDDTAMDAAEGVRSSGMQLPAEPAAATDYEKAWEQA